MRIEKQRGRGKKEAWQSRRGMHLLLLLELGGGDLSVGLEDGDDEGEAEIVEWDGEGPRKGRLPNPRAGDGLRKGAGELHQVQGLVLNPWKVLHHYLFLFFFSLLLGRGRGLLGGRPGLFAGDLGAKKGEGGGAPAGESSRGAAGRGREKGKDEEERGWERWRARSRRGDAMAMAMAMAEQASSRRPADDKDLLLKLVTKFSF